MTAERIHFFLADSQRINALRNSSRRRARNSYTEKSLGEKNIERIMDFYSKIGEVQVFVWKDKLYLFFIDIIYLNIDKIYKMDIILLEIKRKILILLKRC